MAILLIFLDYVAFDFHLHCIRLAELIAEKVDGVGGLFAEGLYDITSADHYLPEKGRLVFFADKVFGRAVSSGGGEEHPDADDDRHRQDRETDKPPNLSVTIRVLEVSYEG
jgi:hypothetical protein